MHYKELKQAWAELTAPGAPFEVETIEVRGVPIARVQERAAERARRSGSPPPQFADRDYLVYQDERITYAEAHRAGRPPSPTGCSREGVKPGDRVAIAMRNYPEWLLIYWACVSHRRRRGRHERLVGGRRDRVRAEGLRAEGRLLRRRAAGAHPGAAGDGRDDSSWWRRAIEPLPAGVTAWTRRHRHAAARCRTSTSIPTPTPASSTPPARPAFRRARSSPIAAASPTC